MVFCIHFFFVSGLGKALMSIIICVYIILNKNSNLNIITVNK